MVSTFDTMGTTDGFQPAIDLRERATDDENFIPPILLFAIAASFWLASYICKYRLHGTVTYVWGIPYCRF